MSVAPGSLLKGTAINLLSRLAAVALVLLITIFTARLGTEAQGAFALFTSVEGVLLALFSGFGVALAREVSHHRQSPRELLSAMLIACVALGTLAAVALLGVALWGPAAYRSLWLLALAAPLLLIAPNIAGWWLGEGRMAPMAAVSLTPPALTLLGILLFWGLGLASVLTVLAAWVVAKVLVGLGALLAMQRAGRLAAPDFVALRGVMPFVATIGLTNLIGLLNYRAGLFVIERVLGLSATGVYSIAVVVAELLWFVSGSLTQAVYGRIGTPDAARAAATTVRAVQLSLVALLAVAPPLVALAVWIIPLALGPAYQASLPPLLVLLPGVLVFGAASALSAYFTNHAGQPGVAAQVAGLSLLLNAGLALLLVPRLGTVGAALAASLAYSASVALLGWRFARHAGLPWWALWLPGPQLGSDLRALASSLLGALRSLHRR